MGKKFISFLGVNSYIDCYYTYKGRISSYGKFVQTAMFELICQDFGSDDQVVIFLTEEAKEKNWKTTYDKEGNKHEGLQEAFKRIAPHVNLKSVMIESEQTEEQNWKLFQLILSTIDQNDEIYFDVTHGFRSFPILALIIMNYARLVKNASLGKMLYGSFETLGPGYLVKNMNKEERLAPIIDMTNMVSLLDWTNGVDSFIRSGDASLIEKLTTDIANPLLKETKGQHNEAIQLKQLSKRLYNFTQAIATSRGQTLMHESQKLKEQLNTVKNMESEAFLPLAALIGHMQEKVKSFNGETIMDNLKAVTWCSQHRLIQQGYTLLQENIITSLCMVLDYDPTKEEHRDFINRSLNTIIRKIPEKDWKVHTQNELEEMKVVHSFLTPYLSVLNDYQALTEYRNNMNHGGWGRRGSVDYDRFSTKLSEYIERFEPFFQEMAKEVERKRSEGVLK